MPRSLANRIRDFVFPIYSHEFSMVIPLFFIFFLISFIYNLLRPLKISLVVTAQGSGADIIPFLKVWAILPSAFFFAFLYTTLSNKLKREQVFLSFLGIFLGGFLLFNLAYPYHQALELTRLANWLQAWLPAGCSGLISVIRHWDLSLFYVLCELWGNLMLTVLAWGFANEMVSVKEAKRFYAILAVGADSAGIFSGQYGKLLHSQTLNTYLPFGRTPWEQTLTLTMLSVLVIGIGVGCLYLWLANHHTAKPATPPPAPVEQPETISLLNALRLLARSRYLSYMAIIVLCYNMASNLFDVLWINQLKTYFQSKSEFNLYMNHLTSVTGMLAAGTALLLSGNVIRRFGWKNAALITPVVFTLTGCGFFYLLYASNNEHWLGSALTLLFNPMHGPLIFMGTLQYCLTRACKYTVFDATKEMAYIPLNKASKRQGKIIIDTLVSRGSKSGSALILQVLILVCTQLVLTTPYIMTILVGLVMLWLYAIYSLNRSLASTIDRGGDMSADLKHASSIQQPA